MNLYNQLINKLGLKEQNPTSEKFYKGVEEIYKEHSKDKKKVESRLKRKCHITYDINMKKTHRVLLKDINGYNIPAANYYKLIKQIKKITNLPLDEYGLIRMSAKTHRYDYELFYMANYGKAVTNYSAIDDSGLRFNDHNYQDVINYMSGLKFVLYYIPGRSILDLEDGKLKFVLLLLVTALLDKYGFELR